jgi:hypothetical protein
MVAKVVAHDSWGWNNQRMQMNSFKFSITFLESTQFLRLSIRIKTFNPKGDELKL